MKRKFGESSLFEKLEVLYKQQEEQKKNKLTTATVQISITKNEEQPTKSSHHVITTTTTTTTTAHDNVVKELVKQQQLPTTTTSNKTKRKQQIVENSQSIVFNSRICSLCDMMAFQNNLTNICDFYFDYVCFGTPLLDKSMAKKLIFELSTATPAFDSSILRAGMEDKMIVPEMKSGTQQSVQLLLLFSILTFTMHRMGRKVVAQQMFDNTWHLLVNELSWTSNSDASVADMLTLAECCILLAYYAFSELGDLNSYRVNYLIHQVNAYFVRFADLQLTTAQRQQVYYISRYMTQLLCLNELSQDSIGATTKFYKRMSKRIDDLSRTAQGTDLLSFLQQAQHIMREQLSVRLNQKDTKYLPVLVSSFDLSFQATKIDALLRQGMMSSAVLIAREITDKLAKFEDFSFCPLSIHFVITTSKLHLSQARTMDSVAIGYLEKDIIALKKVTSTYGLVEKRYGDLLKEMITVVADSHQAELYPVAKKQRISPTNNTATASYPPVSGLNFRNLFNQGRIV